MLVQARSRSIQQSGGLKVWHGLSADEQHELEEKVYCDICIELGNQPFNALTEDEKEVIDFFVWAGCGMHKEMNLVKGGTVSMAQYWSEKGLQGPIKLMNKDNTAAAQLGTSAAKERTEEVSQGVQSSSPAWLDLFSTIRTTRRGSMTA